MLDDRLHRARRLLGHAASAYGSELREAQEVQACIADAVIEAFAIESGIARAEKIAARGDGRAALAADIVHVYVSDAADRIASAARHVVAALAGQGRGESLAATVQPLLQYSGVDVIAARRRIADAVIAQKQSVF